MMLASYGFRHGVADALVVLAALTLLASAIALAAWARAYETLARAEAIPSSPLFDSKLRSSALSQAREWRSALFGLALCGVFLLAAFLLMFWPW